MSSEEQVDVGIVVALEREVGLFLFDFPEKTRHTAERAEFLRTTLDGIRIGIAITGPGEERAAAGTRALCDVMQPKWLISAGYGGALLPQLKVADAVVIEEVVTEEDDRIRLGGSYPFATADQEDQFQQTINGERIRILKGRLLTVNRIVATPDERTVLAEKSGAAIVDMETAAVVKVARDRHLPVLAVRAVSDTLETELPPEITTMLEKEGFARWEATASALWKKPRLVKLLWKLKQDTLLASEALAVTLKYLITSLPMERDDASVSREES